MFLLINCNYDGDTYALFNDIASAKEAFDESCADSWNHRIVLVRPERDAKLFGFGSRGEIFGAEVLFEHVKEEDSDY